MFSELNIYMLICTSKKNSKSQNSNNEMKKIEKTVVK